MTLTFFIAAVLYLIITALGVYFLPSMSVLVYLGMIYLLPPVMNYILVTIRKHKKEKLILSLVLPVFSTLFYAAFSWITEKTGTWMTFIEKNSMSSDSLTVEIDPNGFDTTQIIFMLLTYFGISLALYFLLNRKEVKSGEKYA
ncbi:Msa family membrane protein [Streptococcus ruminicola]|uniref:Msa family membrane protein n=1 Tax=Streptococcus ruminicola TaxID=2686210 RepID=UPI003F623560